MNSRILFYFCFSFVFSGSCLAAEDTWYPKATDSCASFSAEARTRNWPALAQHPELLWRDKAIFKLKSDYIASLDAISAQIKEGKRHASAEENTIGTLLVLQMYCSDHGTTHLGDISVSDIFKYLKEGNNASLNTSKSETGSQLSSHIPAEYQRTISKVLPGYEIFRNEDFLQDAKRLREFLSPDEISERKKRGALGIIVGRFNNDDFQDFSALVINRSIKRERPADWPKSENWGEQFAARLVVCMGTKMPRAYQCEILPTLNGNFIGLPYWADLVVSKAEGEISCGDVEHQIFVDDMPIAVFYPEGFNGNSDSETDEAPARKLTMNYDAIGIYAIGVNDGWTLVRQADGTYLNCAFGE